MAEVLFATKWQMHVHPSIWRSLSVAEADIEGPWIFIRDKNGAIKDLAQGFGAPVFHKS